MKKIADIVLGFFRESSDESMKRLLAFFVGVAIVYIAVYATHHYPPERVEGILDTMCLLLASLLGLGVISGISAKKVAAAVATPPPEAEPPKTESAAVPEQPPQ